MNVLCLSLEELAQLSLNNLLRYETLQRACKSSIYKEKWAGIDVDKIITYEDFSQLPYTTANEVRQAIVWKSGPLVFNYRHNRAFEVAAVRA
jgi:phenylacetate-coenzyme A ligase PaaK-like adenylate-forming protein